MSSNILPGDDSSRVQKIVWKRVNGPLADSSQTSSVSPSGGASGTRSTVATAGLGSLEVEALRVQVAELEAREKKARQQGFQEGEAAAAQKSAQQIQQSMQRIGQSVEETMAARVRMRQQMEEDLVKLAIAVARRILHRELTVAPEALLGIVAAALKQVDARELHRLRVAPPDARALEQQLTTLNLPARVEVVADSALERGSVLLETSRGMVDSSVETQLQEIDRGFADIVRSGK
jgi:flagellar assembly protein FliH